MNAWKLACVFVVCTAFCEPALGQEFRASVTGTVTDPAAAAIVGARIRVTNVERNVTSETVTNEVGLYTVQNLLPGRYTVTVEAAGFKKLVRQDAVLGINERFGLDARLEVGALSESVTVTGEAPILQTETASRGGTVEQKLVEDLPNAGRNIFQVVFTQPGVYKPSTSQANSFDIGSGIGNANPEINGASQGLNGRAWNTEVLIDGLADNRASKEIVVVPALETVQELQVLTNIYDSSYGHTGGGVVSFVTKSGTNTLHGVVFERVYDAKWRAKTWVENFQNRIKSPLRRYHYGFQANGPVMIPKIVDGRNRLFFMLSWDKEPRDAQFTQISNVPSAAMKNGDFSQLRATTGQPIVIYDPLTTQQVSGQFTRTPFAGNFIPANRRDPVAVRILSYFPNPNRAGTGPAGLTQNLLNEGIQHDLTAQWSGRLDYRLNNTHSFFGRFTVTDQHRDGAYRFGPDSPAEPERDKRGDGGRHFTFDWTAALSPTSTFTFRSGFARFEETAGSDRNKHFDPQQFGWPASLVSQFAGRHYPQAAFGFYQRQGSGQIDDLNAANTYTAQGSLAKVVRSHVMKFGAEVRAYQLNRLTVGLPSGNLSFGRGWTQANPLRADALSGDEIATALLGYADGSFEIPVAPARAYNYWVLFFQDDWKVTPKLALNLGLRWDLEGPVTERYNRMLRGFAFDQPSPIAAQVKSAPGAANCPACADLRGGALFAAVGGQPRTSFDPDRNNFQPRIGFAYSLGSKTVLRGGYGLYYMGITADGDTGSPLGFSRSTPIISSLDGGLTPSARVVDPLNGGNLLQPTGSSLGLKTNLGLGLGVNYIPRDLPKSHQVSFGFQRELPFAVTVDVSYVGNFSTALPVGLPLTFLPANQLGQAASFYTAQVTNPFEGLLPDNPALNRATVPRQSLMTAYPQYSGVSLSNVPIGKNRHDAMQLTARRRFQSGLSLQVNYAVSKTLEQLQLLNAQDTSLSDYSATRLDKRLTPFDVPQRLSVIGVYELPFGKRRRYANNMPYVLNLLLGGWTLGWNVTYQAGFPIDFPNAAPLQVRSARLPSAQRDRFRWFDTSLFPNVAGPAPYTLRDFPSRFPDVRFMGLRNWDLDLAKDIPIRERLMGQVRVTAINAYNTPYITQLQSNNVTSREFGQLTVTQNNPPRTIFIDFRLVF